jgi:hypothetical protein
VSAIGTERGAGLSLDGAQGAGVDPDALRRAFELVVSWVDAGVLPGAAALVARGGEVAGEAYVGLANRAGGAGWTPIPSGRSPR